jgi:hypothetical protein
MTPVCVSLWAAELLALRTMLADRRSTLLDHLVIDAVDADRIVEPSFLRLLSDIQAAITAADAEMELKVETEGGCGMSGNANNSPMMKATGLWAKSSDKGGQYRTERLGGVKVLILANKARQSENNLSHILYFVDGEQRRQGPQERGVGLQTPKTRQKPSQPQLGGFQGHAGVDDDDTPEWA